MKKITKIVLAITLVVLALIFSPLTFSRSNEPCQRCHGSSYYQYLDVLEGDSDNQIPSTLAVDQTVTVTVVILNDVNTATFSTLSSVSLTLSSANGHFTVDHPTYTISTLPSGTATATWQITGTSDGYDYLKIQASGYNSHFSCSFSDSYASPPLITVGQPTGTPEPIQTPTPAPTPTPTQSTSTPAPTQTTTPINTPSTTNQPTPSPASTQTTTPTLTPTATGHEAAPTSDWSTTAIIAGLVAGILVVAFLVIYKLRAKKTQ